MNWFSWSSWSLNHELDPVSSIPSKQLLHTTLKVWNLLSGLVLKWFIDHRYVFWIDLILVIFKPVHTRSLLSRWHWAQETKLTAPRLLLGRTLLATHVDVIFDLLSTGLKENRLQKFLLCPCGSSCGSNCTNNRARRWHCNTKRRGSRCDASSSKTPIKCTCGSLKALFILIMRRHLLRPPSVSFEEVCD